MSVIVVKMRSFTYILPFLFIICIFDTPNVFSAPLDSDDNPYTKFIDFLLKSNCKMPMKVKIPFPGSPGESHFDYFLSPLKACQTEDALKENSETMLLCKEIFDVIQNITCSLGETQSEIDSGPLPKDVCNDYKAMKDILPKREDYLSGKLVDGLICRILCTSDKHELLCKTLLWSYETQAKIKDAIKSEMKKDETADEAASNKDAIKSQVEKKDENVYETANYKAPSAIKVTLVRNNTASSNQASDYTESDKSKIVDNITPAGENSIKQTIEEDSKKQIIDSTQSKSNRLKSSHAEKENSDRLVGEESGEAQHLNKLPTKSGNSMPLEEKSDSNANVQEKTKSPSVSDDVAQITSDKIISSTSKDQKKVTSSLNSAQKNVKSSVLTEKDSKSTIQKETVVDTNRKDGNEFESNQVSDQDNQREDSVSVDNKLKTLKPLTQTVSTSNVNVSLNNNNEISKVVTDNELKSTDLSTTTNSKLEQSISPASTETENELGNVNLQEQEKESKVKQIDSEPPLSKDNEEKSKPNEFDGPNETEVDEDLKVPESTTLQILPDEDAEPHQEDKDQYDDTENEEYAKAEYENSFNPPPKIQDPIIKSSISVGPGPLSNNYDTFINTGNNIGRSSGDIPMVPAFPEQEDGHFFFYFLSIVLILMAGYLIFHNKQKIIALIVEGRHERRRRSGAGYRKLETK